MPYSPPPTPRHRRKVVIADPRDPRRSRMASQCGPHLVVEAASLSEVYPLAEELAPDILAIAADFLGEPGFETVIRLADLLGSQLVVYHTEGEPLLKSPHRRRVDQVTLGPRDGVEALVQRLFEPRARPEQGAEQYLLPELILIGASTGGIASVEAVLAAFPSDCPPTLVVQHIRDGFVAGLVQRLNRRCLPRVVEARDGQALARGTVYFAAESRCHLTVASGHPPSCALVAGPERHGHRPAVDPLFESAVPMGPKVAAALLTGMGRDGAEGLAALRRAGAFTNSQDRDLSTVWGMPRAAIEIGAASVVLPCDAIGPALLDRRQSVPAGRRVQTDVH